MLIFYKSLPLDEGFELAKFDKNSRIVAGREVSLASGFKLFDSLRAGGQPIKCWQCGCVADQWISCRGQNDHSRPVLNLFATRHFKATKKREARSQIVMMTRDHIIPKSLGGSDSVENLRPGCELCNGQRGSNMSKADILFMAANPHLISEERLAKAEAAARRNAANVGVPREKQIVRGFTDEQIAIWHSWIGKKVWKNPRTTSEHEPKPFKSGLKVNTVIGVCVHDHTTHLAFRFAEDSSSVECFRCSLAPEDRVNPSAVDEIQ